MTYAYWIAAAFSTLGVLVVVAAVGKPRRPLTGEVAAISVVLNAGYIFLLVHAALNP